jgi:hypothetical protein
VKTGLDLPDLVTILFYETGTRQPSQLADWPETGPVRAGFLSYSGTAQESCLRLMGKKLLVSLAMEGKLEADGLQAMEDDGDLLTAMARELVTRQGVGEQADAVWKALQMNRSDQAPALEPGDQPDVTPADERADTPADSRTWATVSKPMEQMSLF